MTKQTVKVIELEGVKLTPGAKYIFLLHPQYYEKLIALDEELDRLIGNENFTLFPLPKDALKVLEVMPESTPSDKETTCLTKKS